jgi:DNA-binding response OmpR family regulator
MRLGLRVEETPLGLCNLAEDDVLKVLHTDDDPSILAVTRQILASETQFVVDQATSEDEAIEKLRTKSYDAIISSYEISKKNVFHFLKELRAQKNEIVFIMFTGKNRQEVMAALNLGADYYLSKCWLPESVYSELTDILRKAVARKRKRRR